LKVLITGAQGQVAQALSGTLPSGAQATALGKLDLDISDRESLSRALDRVMPSVIINTAAYTAVDRAEEERDRAFQVNEAAVRLLAQVCAERKIKLIHISTDFVFDGHKSTPYLTTDPIGPLNAYGESKAAGERHILSQSGLDYLVVRTAWVYSATGRNFLATMLRLFSERSRVQVVVDQIGTPTSASSLARCLWRCAFDGGPSAILNYTNAGVASWYDFAQAIFEEGTALGLLSKTVQIVPIRTAEYPTAARRPAFSVLEKQATLDRLELESTHWRVELRDTLKEISK